MRRHVKIAVAIAALLWLTFPAGAQVTIGDNTNLNLSGNLSLGYNGAYGESISSGHGIGVGGQGTLLGSYYNPNFLSFRMQPYYNRSQANSDFQSITNTSGFLSQVDLFRGTYFPGSISFGKTVDGTGEFGLPGISGITTHGGSRSYGITWSEVVPDWPSLTASYSSNAEHSEVFGSNNEDHSTVHVFDLQSFYTIDGFHLNGLYMRQSQQADFPGLLSGESATTSNYASNTFSLQATHKLPFNGEWGGGVSHSTVGGESFSGTQTSNSDGSSNQYNSGVSFTPWRKFSFSFNTNYYTNVYATLQQQLLQAGGILLPYNQGWSSSALSLNTFAFYTVTSHISVTGDWGRQILYLPDGDRSVDRFGGSVNFNYAQNFLGSFNFSVGAVDMASEQGNQGAGLTGNVNYSKRINGWEFGAGFNYSQFVQTLLATYTTSNYKYDASVRRRWHSGLYWTGSYFGNHSGLTQMKGTSNRAEGVNTSILFKRYSVNATYTHSNGTSIMTSHGLVEVPAGIPPGVLSQEFQYGSKGFGFGATAVIRRWVVNASYSKANGNAFGGTTINSFQSKAINARLQYRVRKMYFNAGFTRFQQTFGGLGTLPVDYNTYFVGFSRWFNVF